MKSRGEDQNEDRQSKVLARESLRLGWSLLPLTLREDIPSSFRRHAERVSGVQWLVSSGSWPAMWETQSRRGHVCSDLGPGLRSAARGSCIQACASAHSSPTFPPSSRDQQSPWLKSTASCRDDALDIPSPRDQTGSFLATRLESRRMDCFASILLGDNITPF